MFIWKRVVKAVFVSVLGLGNAIYGNGALSTLKPLDKV